MTSIKNLNVSEWSNKNDDKGFRDMVFIYLKNLRNLFNKNWIEAKTSDTDGKHL